MIMSHLSLLRRYVYNVYLIYVYVIDVQVGMEAKWMGEFLKIWADRYKFRTEEKGSSLVIRPERIIVTSNYHPKDIWPQHEILEPLRRRFQIIEIQKLNVADDRVPKPKTKKRIAPNDFPLNANALKKPRLIPPPPPPFKIVEGKVIKNVNPKIQKIIEDLWEEPDAQSMQLILEDSESGGHVDSNDSVVEVYTQEDSSDSLSVSEYSDEVV